MKIEKYIFKTKACDSFSLAPMERVPQNYPPKCFNSKSAKIELDGFTKPGPWGAERNVVCPKITLAKQSKFYVSNVIVFVISYFEPNCIGKFLFKVDFQVFAKSKWRKITIGYLAAIVKQCNILFNFSLVYLNLILFDFILFHFILFYFILFHFLFFSFLFFSFLFFSFLFFSFLLLCFISFYLTYALAGVLSTYMRLSDNISPEITLLLSK